MSTSKTAERARDCSTISRSFSAGASPGDREVDADPLVAVAHLVGQAQDALQVDVAFDLRFHRCQGHAARRGDVGDAGGDAAGQAVQEEFDRASDHEILPDEHGRMIGVEAELRPVPCSPPAPVNDSMRVSLWVPLIHRLLAQNWNFASAACRGPH